MAGRADVLFGALIPDNRKKSQEERNDRDPGCPTKGLLVAQGTEGFFPQIGSQEPCGVCFGSGRGTVSMAGMRVYLSLGLG